MVAGLPVSRNVSVSVTLTPVAAQSRNFGAMLVVGSSDAIDLGERIRAYSTLAEVAGDFGTTAPEYLAAVLHFSQSPQPSILYAGRWAEVATAGTLLGGALLPSEQVLSNFTSITNGSISILSNGSTKTGTAINLSTATSLANVATLIQASTTWGGTWSWNAYRARFEFKTSTTGAGGTVAAATTGGAGTDLSAPLKVNAASALRVVQGAAAETALAAVQALADRSLDWYGLTFADTSLLTTDHLQIASYIEAAEPSRIYAATTQDTNTLAGTYTTDLASQLRAAGYNKTLDGFSSTSPYQVATVLGRMSTVDYDGTNTTITLKYKQAPGLVPEALSTSQANALKAKNCNVFAAYQNGTAILQEGVMASGVFIDERHGLDWLQNDIQTAVFNLLYTSSTKIAQTEAGINKIVAVIEGRLAQGVTNGLIAPGIWTSDLEFGALTSGANLPLGYYVYANPLANQSQADREARIAPLIQVAVKLAGAVHFANVAINVNR